MPKTLSEVLNELDERINDFESRIKNLEDAFCDLYCDCYDGDEYEDYDDGYYDEDDCCDCWLCNAGYHLVELDEDYGDYDNYWYDSEDEYEFTIELQFDDDEFEHFPCKYCGMWSPYFCVEGK